MITEITINCEDERELLVHLSVIRRQINREVKKQQGELKVPSTLQDSGCYGDHTVNIIPECTGKPGNPTGHFPDGNGFCLSCGEQLLPY